MRPLQLSSLQSQVSTAQCFAAVPEQVVGVVRVVGRGHGAGVAHALVDEAVAVVVLAVADLGRGNGLGDDVEQRLLDGVGVGQRDVDGRRPGAARGRDGVGGGLLGRREAAVGQNVGRNLRGDAQLARLQLGIVGRVGAGRRAGRLVERRALGGVTRLAAVGDHDDQVAAAGRLGIERLGGAGVARRAQRLDVVVEVEARVVERAAERRRVVGRAAQLRIGDGRRRAARRFGLIDPAIDRADVAAARIEVAGRQRLQAGRGLGHRHQQRLRRAGVEPAAGSVRDLCGSSCCCRRRRSRAGSRRRYPGV